MTAYYTIAFDQVLLHKPFALPDSDYYLFMRASVFDPGDLDNAIWTGSVGGLSPTDANAPGPEITSNIAFRRGGIPPDVPVRNDTEFGPQFSIADIPVNPGQSVRLDLVLAPETWITQVPSDQLSTWDKTLILVWSTAAGSIGGPWGAAIGFLTGLAFDLFSSGGDTDVPCWNAMLAEQQEWTKAELDGLVAERTHEYGPTGDDPTFPQCGRADASYWIAFQVAPQFAQEPGCLLLAQDDAFSFKGQWGDFGWIPLDQVEALITAVAGAIDTYDVRVLERASATRNALDQVFRNVPVTHEPLTRIFRNNAYQTIPFAYRAVRPVSADCSAFTNINPHEPAIALRMTVEAIQASISTGVARIAGAVGQAPGPAGPGPSGPGGPPGDGNRGAAPSGAGGAVSALGRWKPDFAGFGAAQAGLERVPVLRLSPDLVLIAYGEFHGERLLQGRLRYVRTSDRWLLVDVMLLPTNAPPR